jgi:hypothetical protein
MGVLIMLRRQAIKPQDVVILFSLLLVKGGDWVIAEIANRACLSVSEAHAGIKRLEVAGLLNPMTRSVVLDAAEEFLVHGLRYAFPASKGKVVRGMPTAHSAPPLSNRIVSESAESDIYVWPCAFGQSRGTSVHPLYKSVPDAAQKDPGMYEFLALSDALCIGRARERKIAAELLVEKLREGRGQ